MDTFNEDLNKALRYGVEHSEEDFHRKILEDTREKTPVLVYADWLEEKGKPALANMLRTGLEDVTGIMHYDYAKAMDGVSGPHSVFIYRTIDRGSGRKITPLYKVCVKSPHPDGNGVIAFNSDHIPRPQAEELVKSLLAEGHPAGNDSAKSLTPSSVK